MINDRWLQSLDSSQTCAAQVQLNNICRKIHNIKQENTQYKTHSYSNQDEQYMQHVPDRSSIVFCLDGRCLQGRQDMKPK